MYHRMKAMHAVSYFTKSLKCLLPHELCILYRYVPLYSIHESHAVSYSLKCLLPNEHMRIPLYSIYNESGLSPILSFTKSLKCFLLAHELCMHVS